MTTLLDTQIIIWLEENPDKIPKRIKEIIENASSVYVSKASVWEMAIKINLGKLNLKNSLAVIVKNFQNGFKASIMNIELPHIYQTQQLPLHHRDPFDRLLIAQSLVENIDIVSSDEAFDAYGIKRIW